MLRTATGAFGITLMGVVQFRRTPFHQLDLADHLGGRRFASLDLLSQFSERLQASGFSADMAPAQIGEFYSPRGVFVGDERRVSARCVRFRRAGRLRLARALDRHAHETRRKVARGRSRRNDRARMISRFLLGAGWGGLLLLFAGCASTSNGGERAEFLEPPPMGSILPQWALCPACVLPPIFRVQGLALRSGGTELGLADEQDWGRR
jgi:hypothetical protein